MYDRLNADTRAGRTDDSPSKSSRSREKAKATTNAKGDRSRMLAQMTVRSGMNLPNAIEEDIVGERSVVLAEKQAQLQRVFDRHDDMVRELYHMHCYKLMLAYDPLAVKYDNTPAFSEWKAQYDLLDKVSTQAGPSRRTRGTRSEQLSLVSSFPTSPPQPRSTLSARVSKDKLPAAAIHGIISATVGKVHERERRATQDKRPEKIKLNNSVVSPSTRSVIPKKEKPHGKLQGERIVLSTIDVDQSGLGASPPILASPTRRTRAKDHVPVKSVPLAGQRVSNGDVPAPEVLHDSISVAIGRRSSRHRAEFGGEPPPKKVKLSVETPGVEEHLGPKLPVYTPKTILKNTKPRAVEVPLLPPPTTPSPHPFLKIKRIKLLVRRPLPSLSHPHQRPPPPKHGCSLPNFLASYKMIGDDEINEEKLAKQVQDEARIRNQETDFRRQGRFIPGTDVLFGSDPNILPYEPPRRTTRDVWDDIVEIITVSRRKASKKSIGQQIAGQIASKVQMYWDSQELKKDRARAQEEKRLRALAKAMMKMVNTGWKKAVHHVREQKRLKSEAEERRRGHEHLDAILDQSGQLLETQQGDLKKARSRSGSMDIGLEGWDDIVHEDDDEETDAESTKSSNREELDEIDAASDVQSDEGVEEGLVCHEGPSEIGDGEESGNEEEDIGDGDEDIGEDTALLLGPVTSPKTEVFEGEDAVDDIEMAMNKPSDPPSRLSPTQEMDEIVRGTPVLSPSAQPTETSSPERELSKEIDDVSSPQTQPSMDGMVAIVDSKCRNVRETPSKAKLVRDEGEEEEEEEEEEAKAGEQMIARVEEEEEEKSSEKDGSKARASESIEVNPASVEQMEGEVEENQVEEMETLSNSWLPAYLQPFAVAQVDWDTEEKIKPPLLLRGVLRPYQQTGLEWLASLHSNNLNGILADEMGLGKTIQTISLLAHLACDRGIWGPHLIIVPTSVLLNWEMEFKKFLPGFKVLSYHGTTKRRKELRQGWNDKYHFNACITSYTLASRDAHIFKRKPWYYMILDEAHMIKNFKSQRWNLLLMFRSFRRLLLTGTPLQNNLTELWALLQFLMSGSNFANLKEFGDWFSNPLEKAIEMGNTFDDETMQRVMKLHTVLRPYLLRRLKRDVEKELPSKFEHLILCPLSKRQRFLYDEFMSRAQTRDDLQSGVYQKIANILMQLRKVCNHPDLFEVRPIVTSFAMERSAVADFEIKELLIRKRWLEADDSKVNLGLLGYQFIDHQDEPLLAAVETRRLSASAQMPHINDLPGEPPPKDTRTIAGYQRHRVYMQEVDEITYWKHTSYVNELRCFRQPIYSAETLSVTRQLYKPLLPLSALDLSQDYFDVARLLHAAVLSYRERADTMVGEVQKFAFVTPCVVALDLPRLALGSVENQLLSLPLEFDGIIHPASVKLQISFPDPSLLQYDCGKLQQLKKLLQEKKAGGHRILIFTQMTRILDILEVFLNLHGYLYLRLDGATKIEDRQYITERFNADPRIFCFIASSRSGGVGINLTGADTVIFYDSDFNPQMDKQCEDRAHRIGQIRDVHIYRFVSQHTVEEAMLRKANQKRSLDDIVIQKGEFDWRAIFEDKSDTEGAGGTAAVTALTKALGEFEDAIDARAAAIAASEEYAMEGADNDDFGAEAGESTIGVKSRSRAVTIEGDQTPDGQPIAETGELEVEEEQDEEEEGGTVVDYMLAVVEREYDSWFKDWRL